MSEELRELSYWTDRIEEKIEKAQEVTAEDMEAALSHITEEKDKGLFGLSNYYKAYYCLSKGRQEECLKYLNESIRCMVETPQERHVSRSYNLLGVIAHGQNNLILAMEQYDKAMLYARRFGDYYMQNLITSNVADVYYRIGAYDKAFHCYQESIAEYLYSGNDSDHGIYNYILLLSAYGYCLTMAGKLPEAKKVSDTLNKLRQERVNKPFPALCAFTFLALLQYKEENKELSEEYLKKAIQIAMDKQQIAEDGDLIMNLVELLVLMERYEELDVLLDSLEALAAGEHNDGMLLQLLFYRLKYCGENMTEEQYIERAKSFFTIRAEYEEKEDRQILYMMEMKGQLWQIEEEQKSLQEKNEKLRFQVKHDALSGLYNKGYMNRYGEEVFEQALKKEKALSVLFIDIDFFKEMNDHYGHQKGDECIREVADSIRECMPQEFCARYGGDEFVVISYDCTEEDIRQKAEQLVKSVRQKKIENQDSKTDDYLTVTVGAVYGIPKKGNKVWDFLGAADMALYEQKQKQKGEVRFISEDFVHKYIHKTLYKDI